MIVRIRSAVIALALYIPFILLGGGFFAFAMWVIGVIGLFEFAEMQKLKIFNHIGLFSVIGLTSLLVPQIYMPELLSQVNTEYLFYICCLILLVFTVFNHRKFNFVNAAIIVFACIYIGYGFRFLILIRNMGLETIIYLLVVVWATDSGAYFVGKQLGKRPLAPDISPNKTIEGMIGGVLTAVVVGSVYVMLFQPHLGPVNQVWILTIVISLFGQFGDLVESAFKRHFDVKDSGKFLPGHGGMLDRFDSLIFASFIMMIWINLFR
ncbi:phosphatidate cytidylyltransferase [Aerococcaceae bacterium DSM 111021]|nr:phosphatidate cytidylyltransferase [Aerococcaceae bacterium DSM 111021]